MGLSFVDGIRRAAARNAAAPALVTGGRVVTHKELLDLVARIGNLLADRGLRPRSKIFLNFSDPDMRLAAMIATMHCGMIPFALLELGEEPAEIDYDLVLGAYDLSAADPKPDLVIDQKTLAAADPQLRNFPDRSGNDILFVAATTGTTGRRKLVAETVGRFEVLAAQSRPSPAGGTSSNGGVGADDRLMRTTGDATKSSLTGALRALGVGATYVRFEPNIPECLRLINILGVTRLVATPAALTQLVDGMERLGVRCPSLLSVNLTGSLFGPELLQRAERQLDATLFVTYGSAEAGNIAFGRITSATFRPGYVGELSPNLRLIGTGSREEPAGLVIASVAGGFAPYYTKGTAAAPAAMLALPDLGYAEGFSLYLLGRGDEVLNMSGNKTAFSIIEGALRQMPGVRDVAIVGGAGEAAGAIIAVVADAPDSTADIVERVCRIARIVPQDSGQIRVFRMGLIPRNVSGKVDRNAVVQAFRRSPAP